MSGKILQSLLKKNYKVVIINSISNNIGLLNNNFAMTYNWYR